MDNLKVKNMTIEEGLLFYFTQCTPLILIKEPKVTESRLKVFLFRPNAEQSKCLNVRISGGLFEKIFCMSSALFHLDLGSSVEIEDSTFSEIGSIDKGGVF